MTYKTKFILFLLLTQISILTNASVTKPLVLNDINWPPFFFNEKGASLEGIAKEIIANCIDQQEYNPEFIKLPVKRTHIYMQSGKIDISVYSFKKSRKEFLIYGKQPMFVSDYGFLVRADSNIEIKQLSDLTPLTIGHLAGLSHTPEIMSIIDKKRLKQQVVDGYSVDAMFKQLLAETPRFDVMINSKETFYWRAKSLGISEKVNVLDYQIKQKSYYLTVSKSSKNIQNKQQFLADFDTCLINIKKNGKYQKILSGYGIIADKTHRTN